MAKIMLVEDDNNLREIYGERLIAEGYEIVSAKDGEEALALAVKEKPDLIISDVMMPKISGFDMLDILRQTPETKNTKVIMMTALSQAEDKQRASSLGADKYLVKSQVTLEDVARVVDDVLNDRSAPIQVPDTSVPTATEILSNQTPAEEVSEPAAETSAPSQQPLPTVAMAPATEENAGPVVQEPASEVASQPIAAEQPQASTSTDNAPTETAQAAEVPTQVPNPDTPTSTPAANPAINPMVVAVSPEEPATNSEQTAADVKKAELVTDDSTVKPESAAEELAEINKQIENFVASEPKEQAAHQVAMVEPTNEQIDKAAIDAEKANNPDPTVIAAAPVRPASEDEPASARKKVINPITDSSSAPSIAELYQKELAKEAENEPVLNPSAGSNIEVTDQPEASSGTNNPMVAEAGGSETAEEQAVKAAAAAAAPLETADLTKIEGLTTGEAPAEKAQQAPNTAPVNEPATVPETPPAPASNDPNDPNNIAL
jgi:CheY-like chemotaxis protein